MRVEQCNKQTSFLCRSGLEIEKLYSSYIQMLYCIICICFENKFGQKVNDILYVLVNPSLDMVQLLSGGGGVIQVNPVESWMQTEDFNGGLALGPKRKTKMSQHQSLSQTLCQETNLLKNVFRTINWSEIFVGWKPKSTQFFRINLLSI